MMKLWAEVTFYNSKNAEFLIRKFFEEFNPESSIEIRGNEARCEIVFDERPPIETIHALACCKNKYFHYGQPLWNKSKFAEQSDLVEAEEEVPEKLEPAGAEEETPEKPKPAEAEEEVPEKLEPADSEKEAPKQQKDEKAKLPKKKEIQKIPELTEIARQSTSYDDFVKSVAVFIGVGSKLRFFQEMIKAAQKTDKINWNNIEAIMSYSGEAFNSSSKLLCTKQVAATFKNSENHVTIMKLIKAIVEYKAFDFNQQERTSEVSRVEIPTSEEHPVETPVTEVNEEETPAIETRITKEFEGGSTELSTAIQESKKASESKTRIKMDCMPSIPSFEEVLESVDKTIPIEDRVKCVLEAMMLEKRKPSDQERILKIANATMKLSQEPITIEAVMQKAYIAQNSQKDARLMFSKFINDFAKKHGAVRKVSVIEFLNDLRKVLL